MHIIRIPERFAWSNSCHYRVLTRAAMPPAEGRDQMVIIPRLLRNSIVYLEPHRIVRTVHCSSISSSYPPLWRSDVTKARKSATSMQVTSDVPTHSFWTMWDSFFSVVRGWFLRTDLSFHCDIVSVVRRPCGSATTHKHVLMQSAAPKFNPKFE